MISFSNRIHFIILKKFSTVELLSLLKLNRFIATADHNGNYGNKKVQKYFANVGLKKD